MAGLIARLFGGGSKPPDPNPLPGIGGYSMPAGPDGETGFPGSTSAVRTFKGASPRDVKLREDKLRGTQTVTQTRQQMQDNSPAEFFGGPMLHTRPGMNDTAGANPLGKDGQPEDSVRDTETPMNRRQPQISTGTPGAENVRNSAAERYKNPPGQQHAYRSSPNPGKPVTPVTVQNRFVFAGGGVQTWYMERQMPYTGRGDGARGADLNGQRYYAEGAPAFVNAGQGNYGDARLMGPQHRPTVFAQPAPWSAQYYDTTADTGTYDAPGPSSQVVEASYVSPNPPRSNYAATRAVS